MELSVSSLDKDVRSHQSFGLLCAQVTSHRQVNMTVTSPLRDKRVPRCWQSWFTQAKHQIEMGFYSLGGKAKPRDMVGVRSGSLAGLRYFTFSIRKNFSSPE